MPRRSGRTFSALMNGTLLSGLRTIFQSVGQAIDILLRRYSQRPVPGILAGRQHLKRLLHRFAQGPDRTTRQRRSAAGRRWRLPLRRARSMVGDILTLQLVFAGFLGLLSIGGLWGISQAVIQDNLQKWAQAWITELEELGSPLYKSEDNERFLRVENYIANFPEITLVRYYTPDGDILYSEAAGPLPAGVELPPLDRTELDHLRTLTDSDMPYELDTSMERHSLFRVSAPVWVESMKPEDLLSLNLDTEQEDEVELIGFVEMSLDFSRYQNRLVNSIAIGSLVLAMALLVLALVGRYFLKGALKPLSDLEIPLARLAAGETEFRVKSTGHKEIMAINNALQTTICALNQRDKMLRRLADYDPLTGLPNRRYFTQGLEDEIGWVRQCGRASALLFIDLDQFKYINDTLGHAAGDRVLVQAACILKGNLREQDLIARFGGDEFTVVLRDINRENAVLLVEDLMKIMQDIQFVEDGQLLSVLCSIGVTMIDSGRFTPDELLSQADFACHEAKTRGRNRYHFHEISSREKRQMSADIGWSQRIKKALKNDSLLLHYQPIIDLETGNPAMYEVLVRLRDEHNKIIPPAAFMPAANRFGLIVDIDRAVIRNAMAALAGFRKQGYDISLTLNLSGYVFDDTKLVSFIGECLERNSLDPGMVVLEITEQVAVRQLIQARGQIQEIMALGCRFALDDFGTGFSSFNYLKHLPVDYIKIDGGFIRNLARDPVDQAMVKSIIQIANAVGKQTIAEYVQDAVTLDMLSELGVNYAQGFHIAKPGPELLGLPEFARGGCPDEMQWHDFQDVYIGICVDWYLRYRPSYRQLEGMMQERGVPVRHTTIHRWIKRYAPEVSKATQAFVEHCKPDYRIAETFVLVEKKRKYLYLAVGSENRMLDFILSDAADREAAERFFHTRLRGGIPAIGAVAGSA